MVTRILDTLIRHSSNATTTRHANDAMHGPPRIKVEPEPLAHLAGVRLSSVRRSFPCEWIASFLPPFHPFFSLSHDAESRGAQWTLLPLLQRRWRPRPSSVVRRSDRDHAAVINRSPIRKRCQVAGLGGRESFSSRDLVGLGAHIIYITSAYTSFLLSYHNLDHNATSSFISKEF